MSVFKVNNIEQGTRNVDLRIYSFQEKNKKAKSEFVK